MVLIFEKHQQVSDISNYQTRIVEYDSFEEYLRNINKTFPPTARIGQKFVNFHRKSATFIFDLNFNDRRIEMIHYAEVIEEEKLK